MARVLAIASNPKRPESAFGVVVPTASAAAHQPSAAQPGCRPFDPSCTEQRPVTFGGAGLRRCRAYWRLTCWASVAAGRVVDTGRARVHAAGAPVTTTDVARRMVGKEFIGAMVAFLTNDMAAVEARPGTEADAAYGSRARDNGTSEPVAAAHHRDVRRGLGWRRPGGSDPIPVRPRSVRVTRLSLPPSIIRYRRLDGTGGGFGGECGDVAFPMVAGPEEVGANDDGGCPLAATHASKAVPIDGSASSMCAASDVGVPAAQLPFRDEVLVASV